jgi:hypothetical protein
MSPREVSNGEKKIKLNKYEKLSQEGIVVEGWMRIKSERCAIIKIRVLL